jgi:hypothetical protein
MYVMNLTYAKDFQAVAEHFKKMAEYASDLRRRRTLVATSIFLYNLSKIDEPFSNFTNRLLELINEMHECANSDDPCSVENVADNGNAVHGVAFTDVYDGT